MFLLLWPQHSVSQWWGHSSSSGTTMMMMVMMKEWKKWCTWAHWYFTALFSRPGIPRRKLSADSRLHIPRNVDLLILWAGDQNDRWERGTFLLTLVMFWLRWDQNCLKVLFSLLVVQPVIRNFLTVQSSRIHWRRVGSSTKVNLTPLPASLNTLEWCASPTVPGTICVFHCKNSCQEIRHHKNDC